MKLTKYSLILSLCIGVVGNGVVYCSSESYEESDSSSNIFYYGEEDTSDKYVSKYLSKLDEYSPRVHKTIAEKGGYRNCCYDF